MSACDRCGSRTLDLLADESVRVTPRAEPERGFLACGECVRYLTRRLEDAVAGLHFSVELDDGRRVILPVVPSKRAQKGIRWFTRARIVRVLPGVAVPALRAAPAVAAPSQRVPSRVTRAAALAALGSLERSDPCT